MRFLIGALALSLVWSGVANAQKFEGLAETPPMGWNSWNQFDCDIDEQLVKETADALVSTGLRDAGFVYVSLDDCWHGDATLMALSNLTPNAFRQA